MFYSNLSATGFLPAMFGLFFMLTISTVSRAQDNPDFRIVSDTQSALAESVRQQTLELIEAINRRDSQGWRDIALKGEHPAIGLLNRLLEENRISSVQSSQEVYLLERTDGTVELRNLYITSGGSHSLSYDELVLRFSKDARLIDAGLAPNLQNYQLVLDRKILVGADEEKHVTEVIDRFVEVIENKNANAFRQLLDPGAHLVSGFISRYESGVPKFRYVKRTPVQYVDELAGIGGELNLSYSQLEIFAHPTIGDVYSATFKQSWETPGYRDVGYVTLIVDLRDGSEPLVHVRKWQEHPFQTGKLQMDIDRIADISIPATAAQLAEPAAFAKVALPAGDQSSHKKGLASFFKNNKRWLIISAATSATLSIGAAVLIDGGESGFPLPPGRPAAN